jgi:hypothetical protein
VPAPREPRPPARICIGVPVCSVLAAWAFRFGGLSRLHAMKSLRGVWDEATARILSLAFLLPSSKNDAWDTGLL